MNTATIRRFLQAPDQVRNSFGVFAFLAVTWTLLLLVVALASEPGGLYAIAPIFVGAAVLAVFAALRSAGVAIQKTLPSLRTAAFGVVAILAFCLAGLSLTLPFFDYALVASAVHGRASASSLSIILDEEGPADAALWKARSIDMAVNHWARVEAEADTSFVTAMVRSLPFVARSREIDRKSVIGFAETRLKRFSGDARLWQVTSQLCKEQVARNGKSFAFDYRPQFEKTAANYTRLLGREVKAADLMPRIPNGRCD